MTFAFAIVPITTTVFYMDAYVRLLQNAKIFIEIEQHYSVLIIFALLLVKDKNKSKEEK